MAADSMSSLPSPLRPRQRGRAVRTTGRACAASETSAAQRRPQAPRAILCIPQRGLQGVGTVDRYLAALPGLRDAVDRAVEIPHCFPETFRRRRASRRAGPVEEAARVLLAPADRRRNGLAGTRGGRRAPARTRHALEARQRRRNAPLPGHTGIDRARIAVVAWRGPRDLAARVRRARPLARAHRTVSS